MRPQTITEARIPATAKAAFMDWLRANGVRHYIPSDARIVITGNYIVTPTFDIGRTYNPRYLPRNPRKAIPVKVRRYRIRQPFIWPGRLGAGIDMLIFDEAMETK